MAAKVAFQYISDMHIEFFEGTKWRRTLEENLQPSAPYLLLAGDIGWVSSAFERSKYKTFIATAADKFEHVLLVPGNHEFYAEAPLAFHGDAYEWFGSIKACMARICEAAENVSLLWDSEWSVPRSNLTVYGTTLWSDVADAEADTVTRSLADYRTIPKFTVEECKKHHREAVQLLTARISKRRRDERFVVLSHHLPSRALVAPRYMASGTNSAFASDVRIADDPSIVAWVAGHTHDKIESGKFHVNPVGYTTDALPFKDAAFGRTFQVSR